MREVSPVIADGTLANIAWLKAPLGAPALPELEVLAACYAGMQPDAPMWTKYLAEIDKLKAQGKVTPDEHQLLRFSLKARGELMSKTVGDPGAVSPKTVEEIAASVKASLVEDRDRQLASNEEQLARAAQELVQAKSDAEKYRRRSSERQKKAFWIAEAIAKSLSWALYGVLAIAVLFTALDLLAEVLIGERLFQGSASPLLRWGGAVSAVTALGIFFGIGSQLSGLSVSSVARTFRSWLRRIIFGVILRIMMEEERSSDEIAAEISPKT